MRAKPLSSNDATNSATSVARLRCRCIGKIEPERIRVQRIRPPPPDPPPSDSATTGNAEAPVQFRLACCRSSRAQYPPSFKQYRLSDLSGRADWRKARLYALPLTRGLLVGGVNDVVAGEDIRTEANHLPSRLCYVEIGGRLRSQRHHRIAAAASPDRSRWQRAFARSTHR